MTLGVFQDYHSNYVAVADYINLIENAYFATYIFISLKLVRRIQRARRQTYSFVESSNLDWIYYLIIGLFTIVILDSIFSIYELIFPRIEWNIGTIIAVCIIVLYSILGYKGMFQSKILLPNFLLEEPSNQDSNNMNSNVSIDKNSPKLTRQLDVFSEEEIAALKLKLDEILNEKKPYLNESLSLSELAKELGITDKKLSELLNQHLQTNFYNFINTYRVSEVKKKLIEDTEKKYTLLSIAYECGFQSKTSFNRVFKQKTGMSPSKFRQLQGVKAMAEV
ncbi:helix-turn-helix domain-containing protein [Candidatus Ulvibacter alkanivorans]|uniref:helix-turn-helix domain-containing protein n=1 Tax=Candidatus Ulvibacter alkanivorans TaxID=2267620 RepID=UPI0014441E86|nr:helix-turn-helix domain-containing protein [Candidatus Ulvibacter alkanivorans]